MFHKRKEYLIFGSPLIEEPEIQEVVETLRSGWLGTGPKVAHFEKLFKDYVGSKFALALNSCTAGLHLAMVVSGILHGDEVITSPLTFCATANAIVHTGATLVFVDVQRDTMNIDPNKIEEAITPRTRAIIPVHFAGRPCDMDAIMDIASKHDLLVITVCGKLSFRHEDIKESVLRRMCRSFSYRGPDDEGVYIFRARNDGGKQQPHVGFGHQRLSIIDLSDAGRQPISNEDGTIWITFNGEIYIYRQLADELKINGHQFKSDTDTEVVIHLYEKEGTNAVNRLNGMFAFAIWDENLNRLWICRDRIGIKPLVYYWDGRHFTFASEIKALLSDPVISKELDYEALQLYLAFNYVPAPFTIFKGIKKLEPGKYLLLQDGNLEIKTYWETPHSIDQDIAALPFKDQVEQFKKPLYEGLNEAISSRMIADVPLGAFLSGGIDSSIIVALMSLNSNRPVKTFSIGFKDDSLYDETHYAREVAQRYHTDHHEFKLCYKDMLDVMADVISAFDEPFADSSAIPTYIVSRETKKFVTVALSGDGVDELFAGYRSYLSEYWYSRYMQIPRLLRNGVIENLIKTLPDSRDGQLLEYIRRLKKFIKATKGSFPERLLALKEVFPEEVRKNLLLNNNGRNGSRDLALDWINKLLGGYNGGRINSILYSDFKDSLPGDMLTKVDWMSMKNSLEVRVPLLDHRIVELAFRMKGSLKLNNGKQNLY